MDFRLPTDRWYDLVSQKSQVEGRELGHQGKKCDVQVVATERDSFADSFCHPFLEMTPKKRTQRPFFFF